MISCRGCSVWASWRAVDSTKAKSGSRLTGNGVAYSLRWQMAKIRFPGEKPIDLVLVGVETQRAKPGIHVEHRNRQAHVAKSHHCDYRGLVQDALLELAHDQPALRLKAAA